MLHIVLMCLTVEPCSVTTLASLAQAQAPAHLELSAIKKKKKPKKAQRSSSSSSGGTTSGSAPGSRPSASTALSAEATSRLSLIRNGTFLGIPPVTLVDPAWRIFQYFPGGASLDDQRFEFFCSKLSGYFNKKISLEGDCKTGEFRSRDETFSLRVTKGGTNESTNIELVGAATLLATGLTGYWEKHEVHIQSGGPQLIMIIYTSYLVRFPSRPVEWTNRLFTDERQGDLQEFQRILKTILEASGA